jgi:hypothetical protein
VIQAAGGYCAPATNTGVSFGMTAIRYSLPRFTAYRGGIDFTPPHVRWARQRERELRAARRMWDFPRPPV